MKGTGRITGFVVKLSPDGGPMTGTVTRSTIIEILGTRLGPAETVAATANDLGSGSLPTALAGVRVSSGDTYASLLSVSETRIVATVAAVPFSPLRVEYEDDTSSAFGSGALFRAPQVFKDQRGFAFALNQDGTVNSLENPAPDGSVVAIWANGTVPVVQPG